MESDMQIMGKWFKFYRQIKGLELSDIAFEMDMYVGQIEDYENGKMEMPLEFIAAASVLLGVKPDAFFMGCFQKDAKYLELLQDESMELIKSFTDLMERVKIKR